ncbi:hypothetical protein [Candidatus Bathycorpusculum sp.]|uniref:hypothetical protein n=1 Tax=Candidatus Bathycorpusculum sp. TaxID=2994959 RepID=UPI002827F4D3|nr:hypothetical protein [Candidatus Termitimicrobium sp.]
MSKLKIAVISWGSLYWNCRGLKLKGPWNYDGPKLPIEFARKSEKTPLTLVLYQKASKVQTLWHLLDFSTLNEAISALATREGTTEKNIGFYSHLDGKYRCNVIPDIVKTIRKWVEDRGLDAAIWTDLGSNFFEKLGTELSEDSVHQYINGLGANEKAFEKEYVTKTPPQIDTPMRSLMRIKFGWRSLTEYQQGFWLNRNIFILADEVELKKVKREDYVHGTQEAEMLIFTKALEMLMDRNGKILGETLKPCYGIWFDVANEAANQYESKRSNQIE